MIHRWHRLRCREEKKKIKDTEETIRNKRIHQWRGTLSRVLGQLWKYFCSQWQKGPALCTVYTSRLKQRTRAIRATNRCFIRACPARRIEENRPPGRLTPIFYTLDSTLSTYIRVHIRARGRCGRDSQAAENPTRVLDRLLDFEHLLSCPPRVRGATCARIRPYTCNYFGQSVPVKSHASSYIYPKVNGYGIRCRFMIVWCLLVDALPSIFRML